MQIKATVAIEPVSGTQAELYLHSGLQELTCLAQEASFFANINTMKSSMFSNHHSRAHQNIKKSTRVHLLFSVKHYKNTLKKIVSMGFYKGRRKNTEPDGCQTYGRTLLPQRT